MNYTFTAHTACDYWEDNTGAAAIHFVVHFDGKTIVPSTRSCVPCEEYSSQGYCFTQQNTYFPVSANVTAPASGVATIQFVITGSADPQGGNVVPFVMDVIKLTSISEPDGGYPW